MSVGNLNAYRDLTVDEIQSALTYLDAGCDRDSWVRIGMALKAELGASGFSLFDDWSQTASSYNRTDCRDTWKSIKAHGGITIATLIHEAQVLGFALDEAKREPLNQAEIEQRHAKRDADAREAAEEFAAKRAEAAVEARAIWDAAEEIEGQAHPYLERKKVEAFGLRVGQWKNYAEPALLIPLRDAAGTIVSLQAILAKAGFHGRDRDYLKNGQKSGSFHLIGGKPAGESPLVLAAGYATAATIHRATGFPCACVFDDGNLPRVARIMRELFPTAQLILAGDDDKWHKPKPGQSKPINSGVHYARQAASTVGGIPVFPKFEDDADEPTDFNDLMLREGFGPVREQITRAIPKPAAQDFLSLEDSVNPFLFPHLSDKSKPLNTWNNLDWMLGQYGIQIAHNVIRKDMEVSIPGRRYSADTAANCTVAEIYSLCARNQMPKTDAELYMKLIANENPRNPVRDMIEAKPWDGVSRLPALFETLQTPPGFNRKMGELFVRRWLISAVAAALMPAGFWSKGVLVLQGEQSLGKTAWIRSLVPTEQRALVKTGAMIDPANKDTILSAISHWIVELGELDATFKKADMARLKAFITEQFDMIRRPYERKEESYQRRTVFFASVNPAQFLADETGNLRWWTIPVVSVNANHGIDVQQLWAEVAAIWNNGNGEQHWLEPEEEKTLGEMNQEHQQVDPVEELILTHYNWNAKSRPTMLTASQVLRELGYDKPTRAQQTLTSAALRRLGCVEERKTAGRMFHLPPRVGDVPF